jgi:hypothetical protein
MTLEPLNPLRLRQRARLWRAIGMLLIGALAVACRVPDPLQELELIDVEGYWAVDRSVGETNYIAPVARFALRNRTDTPQRSIQVKVNFRREGEAVWSEAFQQASPVDGQPLAPGDSVLVTLKPEGEGRYSSPGPPESMFEHELFEDVKVEVFVRMGRSGWVFMLETDVERRIGSHAVQDFE